MEGVEAIGGEARRLDRGRLGAGEADFLVASLRLDLLLFTRLETGDRRVREGVLRSTREEDSSSSLPDSSELKRAMSPGTRDGRLLAGDERALESLTEDFFLGKGFRKTGSFVGSFSFFVELN